MAIYYAPGAKNPNNLKSTKAIHASSPKRSITGNVAVPNAAAINDTIEFGEIPSNAILQPSSEIVHTALGAAVTMDIGFKEQGPNVLASALNVAAAGTKALLAAVTTANLGKACWELAGYATDPRRNLTLQGTITGAAVTGANNVFAEINYVVGT